jgi:hypothetical protein
MTCTRPQAESQKNPLTRGRRPHMTRCCHSRPGFPHCKLNGCPVSPVAASCFDGVVPTRRGNETPRVHDGARRRGSNVAARRTGAAAGRRYSACLGPNGHWRDASSRSWLAALLNRLDELGWREGRHLAVQVQWWHDQMRIWAACDVVPNSSSFST